MAWQTPIQLNFVSEQLRWCAQANQLRKGEVTLMAYQLGDLEKHVVIITGVSSGRRKAASKAFVGEETKLTLNSRNQELLDVLVCEIGTSISVGEVGDEVLFSRVRPGGN